MPEDNTSQEHNGEQAGNVCEPETQSLTAYTVSGVSYDRHAPPESVNRPRVDGGVDRMHRVNFIGALTAEEMQSIAVALLNFLAQNRAAGFTALTKLEFIEPDTCEYRYWCYPWEMSQLERMVGLWAQLNGIHRIRNIDGATHTVFDVPAGDTRL